ncbi:putative Inositol-5-monophosphate dehydrogenase [Nostocoides japonicum T1-X7]|uniref:Putative Inositol-5-monophosphate dehydrogenase n=1 Tax=Nostocoides japonicum T1-X7 TaxID=1194083 RepID=A0A077M0U5_9MICO|nr:hypothetical protein [Tetrasphaera japonica]CCH79461.1 putative Inositol-5-monophosphate dehydrogenase [Tetrasphaera japonica T1-X7]
MGKHSGGRDLRLIWIAVAVVVVLLVGGGVTYAMTRDDGPSTQAVSDRTSAPSSSSSTSSSPSSSSTGGASGSSTPDAASAVAACAEATSAGDTLAKAASASARDWGIHTQAELDNESGKLTYAEAEARWADSKSRSHADVDGFKSAYSTWTSKRAACDGIEKTTADTPSAAAAAKCADRAAAQAEVASTGKVVNDQWAAHVVMMAGKAHTDHAAYRKRWLDMVHDAGPALAAYHDAAAALDRAPSCTAS